MPSNNHSKEFTNSIADEEFLDLSKVWATIIRQRVTLLTCILLALIFAVAFWYVLPSKWQATTMLQIGQIPTGAPSTFALIEPPAQTAARFDQRELEDQALTALGQSTDDVNDKYAALFRKSLTGKVVQNTNFVQVSLDAYSAADAKKGLTAAAQAIIDVHNKRMDPIVNSIKERLKENSRQLTEAETRQTQMREALTNTGALKTDSQFSSRVVAADVLVKQDQKIRELTMEKSALTDSLLPSNTYPTAVLDATYVPERPYFPKLSLFLLAGLLLGSIAGVLIALWRDRSAL
ncbi:Wzz/FepE/Etk N-terminal domain-containing protein [Glaciimonas soli]|uniref:Polysaccharide chain length determinant N-terminal domain-containing protein n=1 Tax=Glaciimonas soli TaxID=2590999 RepID=A0A843YRN7_9BURK|nr:Wzz/FepE/Etk N-terminal domain-containing protein [Glaciimonas soli]MQR00183.1 hypothetical protein [Glaciimonas soli]